MSGSAGGSGTGGSGDGLGGGGVTGSSGGGSGPGGFGGFGPSPGGGPREPGGPAYDIGWLRNQLLRYRTAHRADIEGNIKFANALDIGATIYVGGTLGGGALVELAGPTLALGPDALGESVQSAIYSARLTSTKVLIGAEAMTMGIGSANLHPINEKVLNLLEEEMVAWEYWRP